MNTHPIRQHHHSLQADAGDGLVCCVMADEVEWVALR